MADTIDAASAPFGPTDVRGVTFSAPLPRRFAPGAEVTLSGRVAPGLAGVDRVEAVFWRDGASPIVFPGAVGRGGDFDMTLRFSGGQRGRSR